jgi:uncharacterized peroxidase-related enzyme
MSHIDLPPGVPGIIGPMMKYPKAEQPLNALAEALLRGPSPLSPAERELIATYVSSLNDCLFCMNTHGAAARALYGSDRVVVDEVIVHAESADLPPKMKALLAIARSVQQGGRRVSPADVARARAAGANDEAIHDTVLIAAAFCMFNRYVDGLATPIPDERTFAPAGQRLAQEGYLSSIRPHSAETP